MTIHTSSSQMLTSAFKFSLLNKLHFFQSMGKIFCVEFQRALLKFHMKYLIYILEDNILIQFWKFKNSGIEELIHIFETPPDLICEDQIWGIHVN